MNITKGIISKPVKVCVYGVEGIGKTTFASQFPEPLFFDLDKGSAQLDVSRVTDITSWPLLMSNIKEVYDNPTICKTLVIDTADAAERMCIDYICGKFNKKGIEDFGYGAGYTYLTEEFARFLVQLDACIGQGVNVVVLAHAVLKTVTLPEEMGTYDHWELKLSSKTTNKVAPLVKEWADLLLFANYKTILIEDGTRKKAAGGKRIMYTTHTTFADAKNRFSLAEELPFDYNEIVRLIPNRTAPGIKPIQEKKQEAKQKTVKKSEPESTVPVQNTDIPATSTAKKTVNPVLQKVYDLMKQEHITEEQIRKAVAMKGYFPEDMPMKDYPADFIDGVLIGAWEQIKAFILNNISVPFN
jgi:hypothetical protein|nr:MAG TPA: AAA domain protein [Caudoviricetes sp.]